MEQERPGVQAWFDGQIELDPERLIFNDGEPWHAIGSSADGERRQHQNGAIAGLVPQGHALPGVHPVRRQLYTLHH